ncbi:MAG: RusA family crossover junction endodeoxyribonuclease [Desulfobulbia bacterium]
MRLATKLKGEDRYLVNIAPCPAPRMTKSDRWKKRPCVIKYFNFKDALKLAFPKYVNDTSIIGVELHSYFAFPKSYSKKKKKELITFGYHQVKPDADNLIKAVCDGLFPKSDSQVAIMNSTKYWAEGEESFMMIEFIRGKK